MNWPTSRLADGTSPVVIELGALSNEVGEQARYLVVAGERLVRSLKDAGFEVVSFQVPVGDASTGTTIPLLLKRDTGAHVLVYSNARQWDHDHIRALRTWLEIVRGPARIDPAHPVLVVSPFDSAVVPMMVGVHEFVLITTTGNPGSNEPPAPDAEPSGLRRRKTTPEFFGSELGADCVTMLGELGMSLDYSTSSLTKIDTFLEQLRGTGSEGDPRILTAVGCYVGEVICVHLKGAWRDTTETAARTMTNSPAVVELPGGMVCNPLGKARKRVEQGAGESIPFFFRMLEQREKLDVSR